MKKLIMATIITVYLALCAAVWPQTEVVETTPMPSLISIVHAAEPPVVEPTPVAKTELPTEKEKVEIPQLAPPQAIIHEPESAPAEAPAAPEPAPIPEPEPAPTSKPTPAPTQTDTDLQPGDLVHVKGFGWLEYQSPNEVIYAEDIYENGNKIGIMG